MVTSMPTFPNSNRSLLRRGNHSRRDQDQLGRIVGWGFGWVVGSPKEARFWAYRNTIHSSANPLISTTISKGCCRCESGHPLYNQARAMVHPSQRPKVDPSCKPILSRSEESLGKAALFFCELRADFVCSTQIRRCFASETVETSNVARDKICLRPCIFWAIIGRYKNVFSITE